MHAPTLGVVRQHGRRSPLAHDALADVRTTMRGPVLTPSDAGYEDARRVWNARIDHHPALIARCADTADVVHAVSFARRHELLVSVCGGGHNIAGLAMCEGGLVIDLSLMRAAFVDPLRHRVRAQGGCLLGDVDRATQAYGQATVLGVSSLTGIGGLTTGGGFGYLTRRFGWTCDSLRSMEVVMADGRVVTASVRENPELFWCLRGGGGDFGVVTSFEYRTYDVGPMVLGGIIAWHAEEAPEVLRLYREIAAAAPRELTMAAMMRLAPRAPWLPCAAHGRPIIGVLACHTGDLAQGQALLAPLRAQGRPLADVIVPRPYLEMQSMLDATQPRGRRYYWKSEYLAALPDRLLERCREHAADARDHSAVSLFHVEGALNELPSGYSPAGNRDAAYLVSIAASWDDAADDDAQIAWARRAWQAMRPLSTGGVHVNLLTEDEGLDRVTAAYGQATYDRLGALKRRYDPTHLFGHTKQLGERDRAIALADT